MSLPETRPLANYVFALRDHAAWHYFDRVMVAFELKEDRADGLRDVREVFGEKWGGEMWGVWWWVNSEEKAQTKMERWRREEVEREGFYEKRLRWM
jgi:hypothetical protein